MEISAKKLAEQRRSCTQQFHLTFGSHLRGPQPLMSPTQTHHEQEDFGDTPNLYDVPKYEYIFCNTFQPQGQKLYQAIEATVKVLARRE